MKVSELIEALMKCDPDMQVMIDGLAEGGIWDIDGISEREVLLNVNESDPYMGPHRPLSESEERKGLKGVRVVVI